jgi:2-octaprenylphenol hydroxylase
LDLNNDRYTVEFADGRSIEADVLIGADGGASFVRESAGIDVQVWQYAQTAFVTHLRPEIDHRNTAWQRFLQTGPVALLPLGDGRVSTVWSTTSEMAREAQQATDEELGRMLSEASDWVLGELTPGGPRGSFPLRAQHADHYVLPGLALAGDAAHSVHPLAGQGVNLGFADAESLAVTIITAIANEEHPGDLPVLRRFERARKGANRTMLHFIDGISRLFVNESESLARLRGGGIRLFNLSGPVRQYAVQVALGITR